MCARTPRYSWTGRKGAIVVCAAIVLTYMLLVCGVYSIFTSQIPSGNDFFPRWYGTRALILEGRDPYSYQVTSEIQRAMYGRLAREDEDQVAFAYPLYVSLFVLPFALLPYAVAQACWLSALILAVLATLILILRTLGWQPSATVLLGLGLWVVLFYPTARSIVLGQTSIIVLALITSGLWALGNGHPILAGALLALSTIKPQMTFLILPFLILLAGKLREHRALIAFPAVWAMLLAASWLLLPGWIGSFINGLTAYHSYTNIYRGGASPIGYAIGAILPPPISGPSTLAASVAVVAVVGYAWFGALTERIQLSTAFTLTLVATLLLPGETGTTNQVLLLLPLIYWLSLHRKQRWLTSLVFAALVVGPWAGFLYTVQGNLEHPAMVLPIPFVTLLLLGWRRQAIEAAALTRAL